MNKAELVEMKEERLANAAVTAFIGSLLVGQSWEWWESSSATAELLTIPVPDYSELVILALIYGFFGMSVFLAASSMIAPLQRWGLSAARSASPVMLPIVSASFVLSWLSSSLEFPHDQWWSAVLFIGGFLMFIFIGFRSLLTSCIRFLSRLVERVTVSEQRYDTESRSSSAGEARGTPNRTSLSERLRGLRSRCHIPESRGFWIIVSMIVASIGVVPVVVLWDSLAEFESASATIRNVGLVIAGLIALPLAVWRALVADRQASAAQQQASSALNSMLNDRYQRGADMLGSEAISVRTGGIYTLRNLSEKYPNAYHLQVMRVFCAFVRHPTKDESIEFGTDSEEKREQKTLRADVQDIMQAIGSRSLASISLERKEKFILYLRGADMSHLQIRAARLSGAWLTKADLSGSVMPYADLSGARLRQVDLSRVQLRHADLSGAKFWGANLSDAILYNANLSGADLCGVEADSPLYKEPAHGLTQAQIDEAWADSGNPPKLHGVLDAETGKQLIWRGGAK